MYDPLIEAMNYGFFICRPFVTDCNRKIRVKISALFPLAYFCFHSP